MTRTIENRSLDITLTGGAQRLAAEIYLSWQFIRYDFSSTIMPASLFMIAALSTQPFTWPTSLPSTLLVVLKGLLFFWLNIYAFNLSNQITGLEEDRINKPDRPLPQGLTSVRGARIRWYMVMAVLPLVGWLFGVLEWALMWQVVLTLHNFGGWGRHWLTKNLCMSLGVFAQLAGAWQVVMPITPMAWRWILLLSIVIFPLVSLQDLRDIKGDLQAGRRTFPIVFGIRPTRWYLFVSFLILPLAVWMAVMEPLGFTVYTFICSILLTTISFAIAARVVMTSGQEADHDTYMYLTYWYCFALASAIILL
jgi:4-hydroxybenzoate polyprenyltransferase